MNPIIVVLALVLGLAATILAFVFILPEKKREGLNKLGQLAHDFLNFKYLIIEKILQFVYILATATTILLGFFMLFCVEDVWYRTIWYGGYGLLLMIVGPFAIRVVYELLMMLVLLVKNVTDINRKLKDDGNDSAKDIFATPDYKAVLSNENKESAPFRPVAPTCPNCGNVLNPDGSCSYCNH